MIKRKKAVGGVALAAVLTVAQMQTTFADFNAVYDSNRKAVTVSGTTVPGKAAVITIGKGQNGVLDVVEAVKADGNGAYEIDILLPSTLLSGKYYVNVSGEAEPQDFMHIDEVLIGNSLPGLNAVALDPEKTARDLENYLTTHTGELAIDAALLSEYATELSDILFLNYPTGGINQVSDFTSYYYQSLALSMMAKGESIEQAINNYGVYFMFDAEGIYNALSNEAKIKLAERLNGNALSREKAESCFKNNAVMSQIDVAATWEMLRSAILGTNQTGQTVNDNFSVVNPDVTDYSKLVDKNKVFQDLYGVRTTLKTISDVKNKFEAFAKAQRQIELAAGNQNNGNNFGVEVGNTGNFGGGSGGSSGGSGGGLGFSGGNYGSIEFGSAVQLTEKDAVDRNQTVPKLKDIDNHWAKNDIEALCQTGLLKGYEDGSFEPERSITRAEFAVLLSRAFSPDAKVNASSFSDISARDWYYDGIMQMTRAGVINGFDGKFEPEMPISRQDMCVMLYRAIGVKEDVKPEFTDAENISDYAKGAVGYLAQKGIVNGTDGNRFAPSETATRAEVAAIINRYLHQEG